MREDYILELFSFVVHHRCVQLVDLFEAPLTKYSVNDISHGTGFINMLPVSLTQLINPWDFQQDKYTLGTRVKNMAN